MRREIGQIKENRTEGKRRTKKIHEWIRENWEGKQKKGEEQIMRAGKNSLEETRIGNVR